ncbi:MULTISPECIES: hypothetical protein [unclassified Streptomyces]|uniref:hypothetical protein n=1 Tax=unclassified Streptomyces TaxID=2593676 RepID=UPI002258183A|nr:MULTISPECIES: hypothetical protein [unclassified Streptomyces]MCX4627225.1 hypothetical protein [Streptomyces sp. NBC_01443]WSW43380.1 hypothetical protein OG296_09770 [Streptomyces sp. NBC_01001]
MNSRPTRFEERLKEELLAIAADRSRIEEQVDFAVRSPARRFRMPLAVGVAAAAAAGLLVALPVVGDDGGSSAAYALSKGSDGTITVRLFHPEGMPGLERELRALGVSVALVPKIPAAQCAEWPAGGFDSAEGLLSSDGSGFVLKINSTTLPPGRTLVLGQSRANPKAVSFGSLKASLVPSCLPEYPGPPASPAPDSGIKPGGAVGE